MTDVTFGQLLPSLITAAILGLVSIAFRSLLDGIKTGVSSVRDGVASLAGKVDGLSDKLDDHNGRLVKVETQVETITRDLSDLRALVERRKAGR